MKTGLRAVTLAVALVSGVGLTACDDGDDLTGVDDGASFEIVLRPDGAANLLARSLSLAPGRSLATLPLSQVESITLPLGLVQANLEGGTWIDAGVVDQEVDLLNLPSEGIELVSGDLPEGSYTGLRFFLTGQPTITLESALTVGRTVYEAGIHDLRIPSSTQSGIKLNALFLVDSDGQILTVLFDGQASVRRVTATGSGMLIMNPVLRVENEDGEEVGEFDDDEGDDAEVEFDGLVQSVTDGGFVLADGTVVLIQADTEIEGDLLSLAALADALTAGEIVEADGEGTAGDGVILATEVDFDIEDPDEDEVEGVVTAVDASAGTLVIDDGTNQTLVVVTDDTVLEGDFFDLPAVAAALGAGITVEAEAEGSFDGSGALVATEVDFEVDG